MSDIREKWQWQTCKDSAVTGDILGLRLSGSCLSEIHPWELCFLMGWSPEINCHLLLLWHGHWHGCIHHTLLFTWFLLVKLKCFPDKPFIISFDLKKKILKHFPLLWPSLDMKISNEVIIETSIQSNVVLRMFLNGMSFVSHSENTLTWKALSPHYSLLLLVFSGESLSFWEISWGKHLLQTSVFLLHANLSHIRILLLLLRFLRYISQLA